MQQQKTSPKTDRKIWTPQELLDLWRQYLRERDRSGGTVRKYTQAVAHFLRWYEREEQTLLSLESLTPIALIGYRNELQHVQHKSTSTINLHVSALRAWCGWMTEQSYLTNDPAAHVKLVGQKKASERSGLKSTQVNALLRLAQESRDSARNYAIVQVLLQSGIRLSECAGLTFADITFGERSGLLRVRAGKGNKARSVPLNASAREALAAYVAPRLGGEKPSLKAVVTRWPGSKSPLSYQAIFLSQKGGALTTSAMGQMIAELVKAAWSSSRSMPFLGNAWHLLGCSIILFQKMLAPREHIAVDGPIFKRLFMGIGVARSDLGIAVDSEVNLRQVLHLLLIAHRAREILLKIRLSLQPGHFHVGEYPLQPAPLLLETTGLLRRLNRTDQKAFQVLGMEGSLIVGTSHVASSMCDEPTHELYGKGRCKDLRVDVLSPEIECAFDLIASLIRLPSNCLKHTKNCVRSSRDATGNTGNE